MRTAVGGWKVGGYSIPSVCREGLSLPFSLDIHIGVMGFRVSVLPVYGSVIQVVGFRVFGRGQSPSF